MNDVAKMWSTWQGHRGAGNLASPPRANRYRLTQWHSIRVTDSVPCGSRAGRDAYAVSTRNGAGRCLFSSWQTFVAVLTQEGT